MVSSSLVAVVSRSNSTVPFHAQSPASHQEPARADVHKERATESEESERAPIERLGRERPAKFKSIWAEVGFCYSIVASQFMAVGNP